jgi:GPR1/FUN34/yaaH family
MSAAEITEKTTDAPALDKEATNVDAPATNGTTNGATNGTPAAYLQMSHEEHEVARAAARFGYGPLAQVNTTDARLPAFGGEFQPGLYRPVTDRKFANPAPLGLSAFALTTFVLGCINMDTRGISSPNIVVGLAFGYGGLVQLLAGMWYVYFFPFMACYLVLTATGKWLSATHSVPLLWPLMVVSGSLLPSFSLQADSTLRPSLFQLIMEARTCSTTRLVCS